MNSIDEWHFVNLRSDAPWAEGGRQIGLFDAAIDGGYGNGY